MKEKLKLKLWVKVVIVLLTILVIFGITNATRKRKDTKVVQTTIQEEKPVKEEINYELENVEELQEIEQEKIEEPIVEYSNTYETRMTSFWANDGYGTGECTGSGLCSWDFDINEYGWYTYQGKLVIATATTYLANQGWYVADGVHLRQYWQELNLIIDNIEYEAIILDSCGNCMKTDRVDLFVSNGESARDTQVLVKEK